MLKGVLHRIEDDLDVHDAVVAHDLAADVERLLQRHAEFEAYLRDEEARHP